MGPSQERRAFLFRIQLGVEKNQNHLQSLNKTGFSYYYLTQPSAVEISHLI